MNCRLQSFFTAYTLCTPNYSEYSGKLGEAVNLAAKFAKAPELGHLLVSVLIPAARYESLELFYNEDAEAVGYIAWRSGPETRQHQHGNDLFRLREEVEWMEGPILYPLSFFCLPGYAKSVIKLFKEEVFPHYCSIEYSRTLRSGRPKHVRLQIRRTLESRLMPSCRCGRPKPLRSIFCC